MQRKESNTQTNKIKNRNYQYIKSRDLGWFLQITFLFRANDYFGEPGQGWVIEWIGHIEMKYQLLTGGSNVELWYWFCNRT